MNKAKAPLPRLPKAERRRRHRINTVLTMLRKTFPHGYEIVKILPFALLYEKYSNHKRLKVFVNKGLACVVPGCPCVGSLLMIGEDRGGNRHVDLYTKELEMMTVDHIEPVSLDGNRYDMANLQPMCKTHNEQKGNRTDLGY